MRTYVAKGEEAEALKVGANWFVIDATDMVLGRLATKVARILIGKDKPSFTPYLDSGDHVVVINADKVRLTGNKVEQKVYYSHSGYPGGLKEVPAKRLRETKSDWMIREAVLGMLPKNKLRARRAKKLRDVSRRGGFGASRRAEAASRWQVKRAVAQTELFRKVPDDCCSGGCNNLQYSSLQDFSIGHVLRHVGVESPGYGCLVSIDLGGTLSSTGTPLAGKQTWFLGTGRRKESVARVFLRAGSGKFTVNGRDRGAVFSEFRVEA